MKHKPNCSINKSCAVYHEDGKCNHPTFGKCDCGALNQEYERKSHIHCFVNPNRPCGLNGHHCCLCDIVTKNETKKEEEYICPKCKRPSSARDGHYDCDFVPSPKKEECTRERCNQFGKHYCEKYGQEVITVIHSNVPKKEKCIHNGKCVLKDSSGMGCSEWELSNYSSPQIPTGELKLCSKCNTMKNIVNGDVCARCVPTGEEKNEKWIEEFDEKFKGYMSMEGESGIIKPRPLIKDFIRSLLLSKEKEIEHCAEPNCPECNIEAYNKGRKDAEKEVKEGLRREIEKLERKMPEINHPDFTTTFRYNEALADTLIVLSLLSNNQEDK